LSYAKLHELPIQFGRVQNFLIEENQLTTLKGCPHTVEGNFSCENNLLTTLDYAPKKVEGFFNCNGNKLKNLIGIPKVGGKISCAHNGLVSLEGLNEKIYDLDLSHNQLTNLKHLPRYIRGSVNFSDNLLSSLEQISQINIDYNINISNNPLSSFKGLPSWINGLEYHCNDSTKNTLTDYTELFNLTILQHLLMPDFTGEYDYVNLNNDYEIKAYFLKLKEFYQAKCEKEQLENLIANQNIVQKSKIKV
jgi:hypothetical protein